MSVVNENIREILSEIPLDLSVDQRIERLAGMEAVNRGFVAEHAIGVAHSAASLAKSIGMPDDEVADLYDAVRWHDLGKLAIPDEILRKPAKLTDDEFEVMKSHTDAGLALLGNNIPQLLHDVILYHHERYDGNGYNGLKGEEIPIAARITQIADVHDAMMEKRDYKRPMSEEMVLTIMTADKVGFGRYAFDPFLLRKFVSLRLADPELKLSTEARVELTEFASGDPMLDISGGWEANDGWQVDRSGNRYKFERNENGNRLMVGMVDPVGNEVHSDRVAKSSSERTHSADVVHLNRM